VILLWNSLKKNICPFWDSFFYAKENINFVEEQSNWPSAFKDKD
jgi:hypothetical protein